MPHPEIGENSHPLTASQEGFRDQVRDLAMKKLFFVTLTSIFLSVSCGHWPLAQEAPGPKMVLKEKVIDFGEVLESRGVSHVFKVLNKGDKPLEIKGVKPG